MNPPDSKIKYFMLLCMIAVGTALLTGLSIGMGSIMIPLREVFQILMGNGDPDSSSHAIVWSLRIPRTTAAILAGIALSLSGLQMQTLFANPLAGPFVLGISSGASLGVACYIMLRASIMETLGSQSLILISGQLVSACAGSLFVLIIVLGLARKVRSNTTLLILGLMFGYASSGIVSILVYFSTAEELQTFLMWSFGSFSALDLDSLKYFACPTIAALLILIYLAKPLNAYNLGETYARSLGVPVKKIRFLVLLSASSLAGIVTAFCGPIAFVGIAVPHLARMIVRTPDHRIMIPACALIGASTCLLADLLCRLPGTDHTLPLNSVTSLVGAPIVVWVILKGSRGRA